MPKKLQAGHLDALWFGSENSLNDYLSVQAQIDAKISAGPTDDDEEDAAPYLLDVTEGIATITIAGAMSNRQTWYDKYFKVASYPAIREALMGAAQDPEVTQILLDINSGGGSVNGVSDTAELIRVINDNIKPITAYTDGSMCSAAYWLACSAGEVYASNVAVVGSIGVISTHMEYSKQLKDDGVGVTVMRAGKFKALVNSVEPLTEEARSQMQAMLDQAYKIFVSHVADALGYAYDYVDANLAQGREFFGQQAADAGLVNEIMAFDALVSKLQAESLDNSSGFFHNPRNLGQGSNMNKKKALTSQQIAALAAGVQISASISTPEPVTEPAAVVEPAPVTEPAAETPAAVVEPAPLAADAGVVAFLQTQVKDKDATILASSLEIAGLKTKLADMETAHAGLVSIAANSISNMSIGMKGKAFDATGISATAILAEHGRVAKAFQEFYPVGGVAAVDAAADVAPAAKVMVDALTHARLAAVRSTAKA